MAPQNNGTTRFGQKSRFREPINYFLGHNISLGLRAEAEDLGLSAELRSLVAPPKGGPADLRIGFCRCLEASGATFLVFWALETYLKIEGYLVM